MGRVDFAAAANVTGEAMVLPAAGEQTVTPTVAAVHPEGFGVGEGVGLGEGVGDGLGLGEVVNASAMSSAVEAAPGYVVIPIASITVRNRFWCW